MSATDRRRVRALCRAVIAVLLCAVTYFFAVLTTTGQWIDSSVLEAAHLNYEPGLPLSVISPLFIAITLGVIALLGAIRWGVGRGLLIILASGAALVLSQVLKFNVLERPSLIDIAENTFPSGHITAFAVICLALICAAPPTLRGIMSVIAVAVMCGAVTQILLAGWHRPSDVVGAIFLAAATYAAGFIIFPVTNRVYAPGAKIVSFVIFAFAGITVFIAAVLCAIAYLQRDNAVALVSACLFCCAVGMFACRSMLKLLSK